MDKKSNKKNNRKTIKKTKIIGTENYINQNSGELVEMQVIEIEEKDNDFVKLWTYHLFAALHEMGNAKIDVFIRNE